ncbi:threonine/serine ThrE exporter family protein [Enterovibrio paralichthyis]|uniref:threonine/serine ThrE exporter family protein n=1 Tax=Enterovibrio paralichthyis TaxID=2853805 RepID=UPI001C49415D|nr:threonine/serine exporter family protein [Enterovibrio paralichthyis]MBV7298865.1 threonine/serine exporter family protein [Enterovibrio paralichthyis]
MREPVQRDISRIVSQVGQMLLQHGAESKLVSDICCRLGVALGLDSVEISLSASSMVITTITHQHCITTARRCPDRGINMRVITEIQRILIMTEKALLDRHSVKKRLARLSPDRYNRWLVAVMVGLSCASFSRLAGGDFPVFFITFVASFFGMLVRQEVAHRHFNPLVNFGITAFVTTLISSFGAMQEIGNQPYLAMASSVLMLVPGFPLINAVSDMVKGYVNMGIARWVMASLLSLATCLGIVAAMNLTGIWGWL